MKEIAILGPEEFVLGFRLAGVGKAVTVERERFPPELERLLADEGVGILVVPSELAAELPAGLRRKLSGSIDPVVIQMGEAGEDDLREKVKRAIGIDLYKK